MRKWILTLGTIVCLAAGIIFLIQGIVENRNLRRQFAAYAWQMTSLKLAELNTGPRPTKNHEQYSLVTEDCGSVELELQLFPSSAGQPNLMAVLNPENRLSEFRNENSLSYRGVFDREGQEYHQSIYILFRSENEKTYHLTPRGQIAGYFSLLQPISGAKRALLISHLTKLAIWVGLCATIWFMLIGVGSKLLDQLEKVNMKLVDAERNAVINKIVCTYNHRINSPLMGIYGSIELLTAQEHDPAKIKLIRSVGEAADTIKEATNKIAALESYRFVEYSGDTEMIEIADKRGKAGVACHNSRSVGYRVG
jgi:hypothetical protein